MFSRIYDAVLAFKSHGFLPVTTFSPPRPPPPPPTTTTTTTTAAAATAITTANTGNHRNLLCRHTFREPGPVLSAYCNGYVPEASLPLRYLSDEGGGMLSLTIFCQASEESAQWAAMTRLASNYVVEQLGEKFVASRCLVLEDIPDATALGRASARESAIVLKKDASRPPSFPPSSAAPLAAAGTSVWGNHACLDLVLCSNTTTYLSRQLEVRCGHGKARRGGPGGGDRGRGGGGGGGGGAGNVKLYVHVLRMTVDTRLIYALLCERKDARAQRLSDPSLAYETLFSPLEIRRSGKKGAKPRKNQHVAQHKGNKNDQVTAMTTVAPGTQKTNARTTKKKKKKPKSARHVPKHHRRDYNALCSTKGVRELEGILSRQSYLCGPAGYIATHEDAVVYTRLSEWLHTQARRVVDSFSRAVASAPRVELSGSEDAMYLPCVECKHVYGQEVCCLCVSATSPPHVHPRAYRADGVTPCKTLRPHCVVCRATVMRRLKSALKDRHGSILEELVPRSRAQLGRLGVSVPSRNVDDEFLGSHTWRWFRGMSALPDEVRAGWLPTMEHLRSGRLSLIFRL